jgi:hypothetical protein
MANRNVLARFGHAGMRTSPACAVTATTVPTTVLGGEQMGQLEDGLAAISLCAQAVLRHASSGLGAEDRRLLHAIIERVSRVTTVLGDTARPAPP